MGITRSPQGGRNGLHLPAATRKSENPVGSFISDLLN
jgi:hypothetical protein